MARVTKAEKARRMSAEQSLQSATTVIAAQPAQAVDAILDLALWVACVDGAKLAISASPTAQRTLEGWLLVSTGAIAGPIGIVYLFEKLGAFKGLEQQLPPKPVEPSQAKQWEVALLIGTLAFGTLKYAGGEIVTAVSKSAGMIGLAL
jgi:hypothetical protein